VYTSYYYVYMPTVSVRLPEDDEQELAAVADLLAQDRSTTMRKALREGLATLRERHAVERYQSEDVSVNEAARLAGLSIGEWLELAHERGLTTQLDETDLTFDAERAEEL
jgi:predicted HTH domain antitoxin